MVLIDFLSVFDAKRGLALLRIYNPDNPEWGERDHKYGKLQFNVSKEERQILIDNHVGFIDIKIASQPASQLLAYLKYHNPFS